jgi:hypothetical protein
MEVDEVQCYFEVEVFLLLRQKSLLLVGLACLLFACVPGAAQSDEPTATVIALAGVNLPATYAPELAASLTFPSGYHESGFGEWVGPAFHDPKKPSVGGTTSIQWLVRLDSESTSAEEAATKAITSTAKYSIAVSRDGVEIPHFGGCDCQVSAISGFSVLMQSADPKLNAEFQGAVAFQLARPSPIRRSARRIAPFVVIRFKLETPSSDRYVVDPAGTPASTWNLARAREALAGLRLIGSMPPGRMTVAARARAVKGVVRDTLGDPVAGAEVTLYRVRPPARRSSKPTLVLLARVHTTATGSYSLVAPIGTRAGTYRIVARLAQSAVSRPVRLR